MTDIIAEAGINHNGSLAIARRLVDIAVDSSADIVKFQMFDTEELVSPNTSTACYQERNASTKNQYDMLKASEIPRDDFIHIKKHCEKRGIRFLCTAYSRTDALFLKKRFGESSVKLASITSMEPYLYNFCLDNFDEVLLSVGFCTMKDIDEILATIQRYQNVTIMHCTSEYPTVDENANMWVLRYLSSRIGSNFIGFSDHTTSYLAGQMAVGLGIKYLEKHFSYDTNSPGPDHRVSLAQSELYEYIHAIRRAEKLFGHPFRNKPTEGEVSNFKVMGRRLVYKRSIGIGHVLAHDDLLLIRDGMANQLRIQSDVEGFIGKPAVCSAAAGQCFDSSHFSCDTVL